MRKNWTFGNGSVKTFGMGSSGKIRFEMSLVTDDFANIEYGFNDPKNHQKLQES
jgi:hypothetical protein